MKYMYKYNDRMNFQRFCCEYSFRLTLGDNKNKIMSIYFVGTLIIKHLLISLHIQAYLRTEYLHDNACVFD